MSNIVPIDTQVPAHLANRIGQGSAVTDNMVKGGGLAAEYPRISIKSSRFRIMEDGTETVLDTPALEVVIIGANPNHSKLYYQKAWTGTDSDGGAPDCFSFNGVSPHPEAGSPQNDLCATCPHNAWGSKTTPTGNKTKACADQRRLAIVSADDPEGPIYLLQVTPAALKDFKQYGNDLKRRGIPAEIVRTKISFDPNASFPKLQFAFAGYLSDDLQQKVDGRLDDDIIGEIIGTSQPSAEAAPAPAPAPQVAQAAPQTAPTPAPEPAPAPAPEPEAPKRGFAAAAAAPAAQPAPAQEQAAQPAAAPQPEPVKEEPAAAPVADAGTAALADEIASLVAGVNDDA